MSVIAMQGAMMAGNTGGGIPAFTPEILSGLTYAMSALEASIYKGGSTSSGLATAEGDGAQRMDSLNSIARTFYSGGIGPTLRANNFGSGRPSVDVNPGSWLLMTRPSGTSLPTVSQTVASLFGVGTKLLIWAGAVDSANSNSGVPYGNNSILADSGSGYVGLHCYQSGGNIVYQWYNYSGGEAVRTVTVPAGTPIVLACRHNGGALRIARDGIGWSATASSGSTDTLGAEARLGQLSSGFKFRTAAMVTCNANNTDADILTVVQQMGARVGLTI